MSASYLTEYSMKKLVFCLAIAAAMPPVGAHAQASIDMSRVTCAQYLAMPPAQSADFSAWMSGWFNQKNGYVFVDLNAYARNVANVKAWCATNPAQTVMAGLQHSTAR
jgi:HdeA/HdeB family